MFQCQPITAAFDITIKGKCINTNAFYLGNAITGIITDSLVYGLSIPIIKPLNMEPKKKIFTLLTLLVGALYASSFSGKTEVHKTNYVFQRRRDLLRPSQFHPRSPRQP
jgi:hypothetical protein